MSVITSDPIFINGKSFVTKTDGDTATVVRTSSGKALTQTEKEIAGDYYNSTLNEINYAEIYNLDFGANYLSKLGASDEWMSEALSSKQYKDAFKKATGKSGSNISFASIANSNLNWEPSSYNKDANGRSTSEGSGKFVGRYPLNKDRKQFDYLQVTAKEYKPNKFMDEGGMLQEAEDRNMASIGSVYLPMQPGLAESSSVSWGDDKINALEAAAANVSGSMIKEAGKNDALNAVGGGTAIIKAMAAGAGAMVNSFKDLGGITSNDIAAYFAGKAVGKNVFTRTTGKILNPNLELLFNEPSLRSFAYTYKFTPREEREAKEIRNIIKFFKKQMAPKRSQGGKLFLESPNVFKLKYFFKNGREHPFLNKIKICALRSFDVQYTPDGSYMTYEDGSMTSYQVSLNFGELNPIYADEIDMSSNDMGF